MGQIDIEKGISVNKINYNNIRYTENNWRK